MYNFVPFFFFFFFFCCLHRRDHHDNTDFYAVQNTYKNFIAAGGRGPAGTVHRWYFTVVIQECGVRCWLKKKNNKDKPVTSWCMDWCSTTEPHGPGSIFYLNKQNLGKRGIQYPGLYKFHELDPTAKFQESSLERPSMVMKIVTTSEWTCNEHRC